jgi:hypothetical protein
VKTEKFCALENAVSTLASSKAMTFFNMIATVNYVNCTICNSLDIARGDCNRTCGDGVECRLPAGITPSSSAAKGYRCPEDMLPETCKLCNSTNGEYKCEIRFMNGTIEYPNFTSGEVNSPAYINLMAGLSTPDKCCIQDEAGLNYSFSKKIISTAINLPIIFSKTGDPKQDCGFNTGNAISDAKFCGAKIPINDYDINCTFIPSPPVYSAIIPTTPITPGSVPIVPILPPKP